MKPPNLPDVPDRAAVANSDSVKRVVSCPFCGSTDAYSRVKSLSFQVRESAWWQMLCNHCHAAGPSAGNPDDALRYWNEMAANDRTLRQPPGEAQSGK